MILCKVNGAIVSTRKDVNFQGYKIMSVCPIRPDGSPAGNSFLAIDVTSSGREDTVLVIKDGGSLQMITGSKRIPENAIIAAVVDNLETVSPEASNEQRN